MASADNDIQCIKDVGPQRAKLFRRLGVHTIRDLLYYLPFRYEDRRAVRTIADILPGEHATVRGSVLSADVVTLRKRRFKIFIIVITDETGVLRAKWFNQPFIRNTVKVGQDVVLSGAVSRDVSEKGIPEMENPEFEIVTADDTPYIHTGRIVPIYRLTEGISQKQFRKIMFWVVQHKTKQLLDHIPPSIIERHNFPSLHTSVRQVHFPDNDTDIDSLNSSSSSCHKRLSFDELFLFELGIAFMKRRARKKKGIAFRNPGELQKSLLNVLPFTLTKAQERVTKEILTDMKSEHPMYRLIQGDVGCGKTIVSLLAMLYAVESGYQAALMAPTEVLAEQHYLNIVSLIEQIGLPCALVTGGDMKGPVAGVASGEIPVVVGTHALIEERMIFKRLGIAVIDEQHKFGVMQRARLGKKGINPDVLVMTATPIPRSLSLTLYGDLDSSVIDELPPNRTSVVTEVFDENTKADIYTLLRKEIKKGRQAYIVYPAIDDSEKMNLKSAIQGKIAFERIYSEYTVGLLHGRMNTAERESIMAAFKRGEIHILVCTTVIEVGVDIPNATIMLIIHAERFGLAQLHQLRGRVGRGTDRSYCLLVTYGTITEEAMRRLDIMVASNDGNRIAEEDLNIRGPGDFLGVMQSGIADFKIAHIVRDVKLLDSAKKNAFDLVEGDPEIKGYPVLREELEVYCRKRDNFYRMG
ncbi:MAG: ATP-dependent DNA helicase RecG [Nitrospiraceae bacterium]|nr:MAG: ATP-dependent DNA helicase RecG [Nitrospiraceae bacterium]